MTFWNTPVGNLNPEADYTYCTILAHDEEGKVCNEKFFPDGILPKKGEIVEMVYVGKFEPTGALRFQLRVRR